MSRHKYIMWHIKCMITTLTFNGVGADTWAPPRACDSVSSTCCKTVELTMGLLAAPVRPVPRTSILAVIIINSDAPSIHIEMNVSGEIWRSSELLTNLIRNFLNLAESCWLREKLTKFCWEQKEKE